MKSHGFTLIELLITISIIALLSAIGFVVYRSVLEQGRDAKRQADLRTIQSALEQYRADQSSYPASLPSPGTSLESPDNTKTYLNQIPQDPQGVPYFYTSTGGWCGPALQRYILCTELEIAGSLANRCCLPGDSCSSIEDRSGTVRYYCVGPP